MTTSLHETSPREPSRIGERVRRSRLVRPGHSELFVAALVVAIGVFLLVATIRMDVTSAVNYLGPRFFPALTGGVLVVLGSALAVRVYRGDPAQDPAGQDEVSRGSDWKPLGLTAASMLLHVLLLQTAGWIIAGALLFWGVSFALGSRRVLRDLGIAVIVSSAVQVAFSIGLGLTLPPGILVGVV